MKKFTQYILLSFLFSASAQSAILTFDDIPMEGVADLYGSVSRHQGFDFSETLYWIDLNRSQQISGAHSGNFALTDANNSVGKICSSDLFDFSFDGVWAKKMPSSSARSMSSTPSSIKGFNNGVQVWSVDVALNDSYQFFGGHAQRIDELYFDFGVLFLMDDLALNQSPSLVPESSSIFLMGLGLLGLGFTRRRKQ